MHFDWYQATVDAHPIAILDAVHADAGELSAGIGHGRGRHNYAHASRVTDKEGGRIAEVLHGGFNGTPNIAASGSYAVPVSETVRRLWPWHRVSRVDVCEDLVGQGVFDHLEGLCRDVGRRSRVKGWSIVPDDPAESGTYYLGATTSNVRVRLYDKTAEVRSKLTADRHDEIPDHWARIELQFRPKKHLKEQVGFMEPSVIWGCSPWTRELAHLTLSLDVPRLNVQAGWKPDEDRALRFMRVQYGRHLEALAERLGSWEAAGAYLEHLGQEGA